MSGHASSILTQALWSTIIPVTMETLSLAPELEALRHNWKKFPLLLDSITRIQDILRHPEGYRIRTQLTEITEPLTEQAGPLSSIRLLYKLEEREERIFNKSVKFFTFLCVNFHLCDTISTPKPSQFSTHISVIDSPLDHEGKIIPFWADSDDLVIKPSLTGAKLQPLLPERIRIGRERMAKATEKLSKNEALVEPYAFECTTWTGIQGHITRRTTSETP